MPSGATPRHIFTCPQHYGGERYSQPVPPEATRVLRKNLSVSREDAFRWVSAEFAEAADQAYKQIGSPHLSIETGWDIFIRIAVVLQTL